MPRLSDPTSVELHDRMGHLCVGPSKQRRCVPRTEGASSTKRLKRLKRLIKLRATSYEPQHGKSGVSHLRRAVDGCNKKSAFA